MQICASGHRPEKLGGYGPSVARKLLHVAGTRLDELKPDVVIVGMAIGWDQAVAWACHVRGIEWWAYVPFRGQESMWPPKVRALYSELLGRAHVVRYVCKDGYAAWKMQLRNVAMVDDAPDGVLALWDGSDGGTANCLKYARTKGREIRNCWDLWKETP